MRRDGFGRQRGSLAIPVCLAATLLFAAACSTAVPDSRRPSPATTPQSYASTNGLATRDGELEALTARGLIDALVTAGFAAPNPLNTSAQECATAGCTQSIVTDTLRIKSFPTTAQAEQYAIPRGLYQVETIAISFAPPVTDAERKRYEREISELVD